MNFDIIKTKTFSELNFNMSEILRALFKKHINKAAWKQQGQHEATWIKKQLYRSDGQNLDGVLCSGTPCTV